jgi:DNA-binding NarL/FixJ family response regulator
MTERGRLVLRALTDREQGVLALVASGLSNKTIAERFGTTEQAIKNNMHEVLKKSGRRNRCELIVWVFHHGVVTCPCSHRSKSDIVSD